MRPIRSFAVVPALPTRLARLRELAYNVRWSWDYSSIELFRRLDRELWEITGHNPVLLLGAINQERLEGAANDDGFLAHYERVCEEFDDYIRAERTWFRRAQFEPKDFNIAYFSAEFGLAEALRTYSGGLGMLAGDHLKSASDLGLPLVGVGLLYQEGYFRQYLNADGWQNELYLANDFANLPVALERNRNGDPVAVAVDFPQGQLLAQVWRVQVGRVPLFLLDTNLPANQASMRGVTDRLYGGDREHRIQQEILLGIGGTRALAALGISPTVCHMNEGHSAFLALERIRVLMVERGLSFAEAREVSAAGHLFTTHTPVPAGIDMFAPELMDRYFSGYYPALGLNRDEFLGLGRRNPRDPNEPFSMAILALHLAARANGVSRLHGETSRHMWQSVWPNVPAAEVPIESVTNGVHVATWVASPDLTGLYERYLGSGWVDDPAVKTVWDAVDRIPGDELWRTHERRRQQLVSFARQRLQGQLQRRGASDADIAAAGEVLDPGALTLGFGRRVAAYKRGMLLFRDPQRLARILSDRERPVQFIIAGKAHPQDNGAKEIIRELIHICRTEPFRSHIVFLEDYDMVVARHMLQGADVWLNTPRRPEEASGTSGMKAALNGVLNMSVLDGWWPEAYQPGVGWRIGQGEVYDNPEYQDEVESNAIYDLLEKEVVPMFYNRGADDTPRQWVNFVKNSVRTIGPLFNTHRMVHDYFDLYYLPQAARAAHLASADMTPARALATWRQRVTREWPQLRIGRFWADAGSDVKVGSRVAVQASVFLGQLQPDEVSVELYYGPLDTHFNLIGGRAVPMAWSGEDGFGSFIFSGEFVCQTTGQYGLTLRVLPRHADLGNPLNAGLILWADAAPVEVASGPLAML
ncbi:MAG: alpha-glucan family phosphorylase [Chloroflexota bacterium]